MAPQKKHSKYRGVSKLTRGNKPWSSRIVDGDHICIGNYASEKEAALAYDAEARARFGAHAITNFDETGKLNACAKQHRRVGDLSHPKTNVGKSGYRGVKICPSLSPDGPTRYQATFQRRKKRICIGIFDTPLQAARSRAAAIVLLDGGSEGAALASAEAVISVDGSRSSSESSDSAKRAVASAKATILAKRRRDDDDAMRSTAIAEMRARLAALEELLEKKRVLDQEIEKQQELIAEQKKLVEAFDEEEMSSSNSSSDEEEAELISSDDDDATAAAAYARKGKAPAAAEPMSITAAVGNASLDAAVKELERFEAELFEDELFMSKRQRLGTREPAFVPCFGPRLHHHHAPHRQHAAYWRACDAARVSTAAS